MHFHIRYFLSGAAGAVVSFPQHHNVWHVGGHSMCAVRSYTIHRLMNKIRWSTNSREKNTQNTHQKRISDISHRREIHWLLSSWLDESERAA